jgi:hypothetical protein
MLQSMPANQMLPLVLIPILLAKISAKVKSERKATASVMQYVKNLSLYSPRNCYNMVWVVSWFVDRNQSFFSRCLSFPIPVTREISNFSFFFTKFSIAN